MKQQLWYWFCLSSRGNCLVYWFGLSSREDCLVYPSLIRLFQPRQFFWGLRSLFKNWVWGVEGTSLEVQWLRVYLPMYRAQVQSLVRKVRFPCATRYSQKKFFYLKKILKQRLGQRVKRNYSMHWNKDLDFFLEAGKRSSHALLNANEDAPWKDIKYRILNQNASWRWVLNQSRHCVTPSISLSDIKIPRHPSGASAKETT